MIAVLVETLVWTGVLIAAVLLLRRPVARAFGPQVAYALWALPMLRLLLPPIVLPPWMAPTAPPAAPPVVAVPARLPEPLAWQTEAMPASFTVPASAAPAGFDLLAIVAAWPLAEALVLLWLGGAGVILWRRFAAYFALRDELLAEAREMGRLRLPLRTVRLIETPATHAPVALGVLDPVIALPLGFMALHDRQTRDLALSHELAHHRGGDLLVNVLVQPLFALHWFTPLGHYGWLALRRDQEAACDARVIAGSGSGERAAYAALIARFAAASGSPGLVALTAPMACPVLGEKSIIHRLRSLSMSDPTPRRRLAGRALLGAALLAVPLTASISYAATDAAFQVPEPPVAPLPPAAPEAPLPPEPPAAPDAIASIDPDLPDNAAEDAEWNAMAEANAAEAAAMSAAEREEMLAAMREGLAEADRALADVPRIIEEAMAASQEARAASFQRVVVKKKCRPGSDEVSESTTQRDGSQLITICHANIFAEARKGLEEARAEIAQDPDIPEDTRNQILRQLDSQIARWREQEG